MRKGWKIFWIVCAVLAAVGLLLTAAGIALGGVSVLSSVGKLEAGITPGWVERQEETDSNIDAIQYDGIEEITLNLGGLAVCVTAEDTDDVQVDTSDLRSDIRDTVEASIECDDGGRELEIDIEGRMRDWNTNDTGTLYITVPREKQFVSFSADMGAGALEIDGLSAYELSLDVKAGKITAENIDSNYLEADCGAGQIQLQGSIRNEAEIECKLGSIMCTLPGEQDDYNYELSWGVGEVMLGNELYSGISKEAEMNNGSSRLIKADCSMGYIDIQFD